MVAEEFSRVAHKNISSWVSPNSLDVGCDDHAGSIREETSQAAKTLMAAKAAWREGVLVVGTSSKTRPAGLAVPERRLSRRGTSRSPAGDPLFGPTRVR